MDALVMLFPVSGVETWVFAPPLVALLVSACTSMGGVSGAILLLPFQVSVLGFAGPAASSTNLVYNIVAIPSGVYRFIREGRMVWPLAWVIVAGTLPGLVLGYYLRVTWLPDPRVFKLFAGLVLLGVGLRLFADRTGRPRSSAARSADGPIVAEGAPSARSQQHTLPSSGVPSDALVRTIRIGLGEIEYEFRGERYRFSVPRMLALALLVGIIGGAYGIGGGAIIAPFCVALFRLPVHTVAGAALFATFATSIAGVIVYTVLPGPSGIPTAPDWALGALFGLGGSAGMYIGARLQRYVSQTALKRMLGIVITALASGYLIQFVL